MQLARLPCFNLVAGVVLNFIYLRHNKYPSIKLLRVSVVDFITGTSYV